MFRLTHLLVAEDGPWDIIVRVRRVVGDGALGRVLDCAYCLSLWLALPFAAALGTSWTERGLGWLGLSGGVVFVERFLRGREAARVSAVEGEPEQEHELLRK